MKVKPVGSPSGTLYHVHLLQKELEDFRINLDQNSNYPRGREDAERFLFISKERLTQWRDQLNFLLTYIDHHLEPKFRRY